MVVKYLHLRFIGRGHQVWWIRHRGLAGISSPANPFDANAREAYNGSRSLSDRHWTRLPTRGLCNGGFANLVRVETQQP
jgi:hypothetical protein